MLTKNRNINIPVSVIILGIAGLYSFYMFIRLESEIRYAFLFAGIVFEIAACLILRIYN